MRVFFVKIWIKHLPLFMNDIIKNAKLNNNTIVGGKSMKDSLIVGLAIGLLTGAVLATHNSKVANMVEKGKQAVKKQIEKV